MALKVGQTVSLNDASNWEMFDEYKVKLRVDCLAGGTPKHSDLLESWINATNKEKSDEERQALISASQADLPDISEEREARSWVGFKADEKKGLFIEGRQIKAMLKEAANIVKKVVPNGQRRDKKNDKGIGITNFKSKLADHVFVMEERVFLDRMEPDEREERPIHVMTAQGPRNSIKRSDLVRNVTIEFTLRRFADDAVTEVALLNVLKYAQYIGLGADRAQGRGTFGDVEVTKTMEARLGSVVDKDAALSGAKKQEEQQDASL